MCGKEGGDIGVEGMASVKAEQVQHLQEVELTDLVTIYYVHHPLVLSVLYAEGLKENLETGPTDRFEHLVYILAITIGVAEEESVDGLRCPPNRVILLD